jgi:hypothetical protein
VGAVLLALTIPLGWAIGRKSAAGAGLTLAILFVCVLVVSSQLAPLLVLLASYDFLGFVDPHTFGRIPGIFKLRDLLLMAVVGISLASIFGARRGYRMLEVLPVRAAIVFTVYVAAVVAYTVATGHSSLNLALRVAAPYFYYLIMIPVIIFSSSRRRVQTLLVALLVLAIVPELLSLFQIITHRPLSPFATVAWIDVGGMSIPRSYVLSFNLTGAALLCLFGTYLYSPSSRARLLYALCALGVLGGVVLTFGRAFWIGTIGSLFFLFVFAHNDRERRRVLLGRTVALWSRTLVVSALIVVFLLLSGRGGTFLEFSGQVSRRFTSTFTEIAERSGTFGGRLEESTGRLLLFRQNPLLGVGYVHESSEFAAELQEKKVGTADSGVITLLAQTGIVGIAVVSILAGIFMARGIQILRRLRDPYMKGVSLGIVSFYVLSVIMFAGLTGTVFTHYAGICTMGLLVGVQEALLQVDRESSEN